MCQLLSVAELEAFFAFQLSENFGKNLAYEQDYQTYCGIYTLSKKDRVLQAALNIHSQNAMNVGLGARLLDSKTITGLYLFYDQLRDGITYHQVALGYEMLGSTRDVRINAYLPIAQKSSLLESGRYNYDGGYWVDWESRQSTMYGFDAECAKRFGGESWKGLFGLGGYAYFPSSTCVGVRARCILRIKQWLRFDLITTYDPLFHTLVQGVISLTIPLGSEKQPPLYSWVDIPIFRQELIVRSKKQCYWNTNYN